MSIEKCFITDEPIQIISSVPNEFMYTVKFDGQYFTFAFSTYHVNSPFVENNKYILKGLMVNKKFPDSGQNLSYDNNRLESIINEANIPRTPKEKRDNLLIFLNSIQKYEGENININYAKELLLPKLFFKNHKEYFFYMSLLKEQGLINFLETSGLEGGDAIMISITYQGLIEVIKLQEDGKTSKNCFIAMWFDPSMKQVRDTIKEVIEECNYNWIIVDDIRIESDQTINDAIISNLKKSKFVIADFTGQRQGVYFEAGFALGQGKQVIYLCSEADFEHRHFDTDHYPHIKYKDHNDLKVQLKNRIQAWID